jgi:uncharacterized protein (TIGR02246 family)
LNNSEQAVREINRRFYQAFEAMDLEQMEAIWLHDDWVQCVHPGWELLLGWEEVRESWERIFANTQRIKVELSSIWVRVEGNVAWVACTEHVTSAFERGFDQAVVQATNIFVLREGAWQMVAHHASPLPGGAAPALQ